MANDLQGSLTLPNEQRRSPRAEQLVELCVFLLMIVPASVLSYFGDLRWNQGFVLTALALILRQIGLASLVLFFLWRNSEPLRSIGWTSRDWPLQIALGILLFPLIFLAAAGTGGLFMKLGFSNPHSELRAALSVQSWTQAPLACLMVAVVAVCEETIFRGYLLLRLRNVTRSLPLAVLLVTVIFTMGHRYEGGAGLAAVAVLGLGFMLVYLRTRSLVAPVVMHFLQDIIGVLIVPLLIKGH